MVLITPLTSNIAGEGSTNFLPWYPSYANAEEVHKKQSSQTPKTDGLTVTGAITDTENLLGDNITKVSDAISNIKERTGVSVRLLYLSNFYGAKNPSQWASDLLMSTNPKPNTVLLAAATHDGQLVVAVSPNSDEWLKRTTTVDAIAAAAMKSLLAHPTQPDWSGSALAMMDQIAYLKRTTVTSRTSQVATIVMIVLLGIAVIAVLVLLWHKKRVRQAIASGKRRRRHRHRRVD